MTPGQTISIVAAVIVSAVVVSASLIMNMPKQIVEHKSTDQETVDNGKQKSEIVEQSKKYTLKDIINYVIQKS